MDFDSEFESICGLVKLRLPAEEKKQLLSQLQKIVHWVSALERWRDLEGEDVLHSPACFYAPMREDKITASLPREDVLKAAVRSRRGMIEVPGILKKE